MTPTTERKNDFVCTGHFDTAAPAHRENLVALRCVLVSNGMLKSANMLAILLETIEAEQKEKAEKLAWTEAEAKKVAAELRELAAEDATPTPPSMIERLSDEDYGKMYVGLEGDGDTDMEIAFIVATYDELTEAPAQ